MNNLDEFLQQKPETCLTRREFLIKLALLAVISHVLRTLERKYRYVANIVESIVIEQFLQKRGGRVIEPYEIGLKIPYSELSIDVFPDNTIPNDPIGQENLVRQYNIKGIIFYGNKKRELDRKTVVIFHGYPPSSADEKGRYHGGMWDNHIYTRNII